MNKRNSLRMVAGYAIGGVNGVFLLMIVNGVANAHQSAKKKTFTAKVQIAKKSDRTRMTPIWRIFTDK